MAFCRNIYVKKVMKLLAFIFEQPSYTSVFPTILPAISIPPNLSQIKKVLLIFLDLDLPITIGLVSSNIYVKRDEFYF